MTQSLTIFHVEDDLDIREIAKMALEMTGEFEVVQQDCGTGAVALAPEISPDILLLDVMMPDFTGPETLQKLRGFAHLADVPAIYMTARVQPSEIEALKATGAIGVIQKPFDPIALGDQIKALVE